MSMLSGKRFTSLSKKKDEDPLEKEKDTILMLYRDANNKEEQITIFTHLYLKERHEICKFLLDHGVDDKHIRQNIKPRRCY